MLEAFYQSDFYAALPLLVMWIILQFTLILDAVIKENRGQLFAYSCVGLALVGVAAIAVFPEERVIFSGMIRTGGYSSFFTLLFCLSGIMTLLASKPYFTRLGYAVDEYYILVLYALSGMMLIAHSNNLLMLFVGVEIMSVSFYVLAGYLRNTVFSVESAMKYFLLGAFSTGFLVYGMTLLYGATGSIDYTVIRDVVAAGNSEYPQLLIIGAALLLMGLSFKVAAFPFHVWVPDVYQGAPTVVTGFMSTAGKAAAFSAFLPIATALLPEASGKLALILAVIAALSMLFGNIGAIAQPNIKRMLAYSSVAHAGYILIGIVSNNSRGATGVMFYIAAYTFMQIGALIVASALEQEAGKNLEISDYEGLSKSHPVLAALMAIFMFSLVGIPPFAGFFGKYYIFTAAIEAGYTWLTIVGVIASMVSVYFYLGLVVAMYFKQPQEGVEMKGTPGIGGVALLISTVAVFFLGLVPSLVVNVAEVAKFFK